MKVKNLLTTKLLAILLLMSATISSYGQAPSDLFISEYVEGSSLNKAIEIYNGTGTAVDLTSGNYVIQMYFNGGSTAGLTIALSGNVANNDAFIIAQQAANFITANGGAISPDQTSSASWYNGDDAIVLRKGGASGTIIDAIGQIGFDPGTEWGSGLTSTADNTLRRIASQCSGDINTSDAFNPSTQWEGFATDTFSGLGSHTSSCTVPGSSITISPLSLTFTTTLGTPSGVQNYTLQGSNLAEDVLITAPSYFELSLNSSGTYSNSISVSHVTANAGAVSIYVRYNPAVSGSHSGNIAHISGAASANFAVQGTSTSGNTTPIYTIQGNGAASALDGTIVVTEGIVTADFQGTTQLKGFYIQDISGDGNAATSDGIFVLNTTFDVAVGDHVRLTGEVDEFFNLTELKNVTSLTVLSSGNPALTPVVINLPVAAITDYESYEGMLVTFSQTLTVTETFTLGRFGELSLSVDGRLFNPTNSIDPNDSPASGTTSIGSSNVAAVIAQQNLNNRRRILLDDASTVQNPPVVPYLNPTDGTLRSGSTAAGLTGVLDYAFSAYRLQPTQAPVFNYVPRPAVPSVGVSNVKIASFNVLNYFNGDGMGGGFPTARGANTLVEFNRQRAKIINAITQLDANVIGLMEMENDGDGSTSAIADLVSGLNAATTAGQYAYILDPTGANGNTGTDAIKLALIYKPGVVTPLGASTADIDPVHNRPPLAQTFVLSNGEKFTVIVSHFKSKSCSSASGANADQFDGQGCYNESRRLQANALLQFITNIQTTTANTDVMAIGDFNAYEQEDPMDIFTAGGLTNILTGTYSYVFSGQSGSLDHALVTSSLLAKITGAEKWHINADEPIVKDYNQEFNPAYVYSADAYRSSDHDPVLIGLNLMQSNFKLQVLHGSDFEGGSHGANFAALIDKMEDQYANTVILSSGDNWIPSPFFNAAADRAALDATYRNVYNQHFGANSSNFLRAGIGRADVSTMNLIGFQASALGNHEFDAGTAVVSEIIGYEISGTEKRWMGAQFPYLSSNLDFTADASLAPLFTNQILANTAYISRPDTLKSTSPKRKIAPATIINVNGERVGVVGATTQILESISSTGGVKVKGSKTNNMVELATYIQPFIDQLTAQGINKIIILSHLQQIALEKELIGLLHNADIIIAGGSSTLLADDNDVLRPGDEKVGSYPFATQNADGEPALLLNTDQEYKYVGRLVVDFNANGVLQMNSLDSLVNGVYATTNENVVNLWGSIESAFAPGTKGNKVKTLVDAVNGVILVKDGNILGKTDVYLEGIRTVVRTEESNLGDLTSDANIFTAKKFDANVRVSIKNGGGLRSSIGEIRANPSTGGFEKLPPQANPLSGKQAGEISQLDIENSLRFNNSLSLVTVTTTQLLQVLNHGVAAVAPGATPGQFAQVGGISFSYNPTLPAGSRVRNAAIINEEGVILDVLAKDGVVQGNSSRGIRIVTLTFLLTGGDGYPFNSFIIANPTFANRVDLVVVGSPKTGKATFTDNGSEQDAFAEYLSLKYVSIAYNVADTRITQDTRIQNLSVRNDSVFMNAPILNDISKVMNEDDALSFAALDFVQAFTDSDGDSLTKIKITQLPAHGTLMLDSMALQVNTEIATQNIDRLRYTPTANFYGVDTIFWNGYENANYALQSAGIYVTVNAVNDNPTASITSPAEGQQFVAGAKIVINAQAVDVDGVISNVEFYQGVNKLGSDNTIPYSFTWNDVEGGNYSLTVKAFDNNGAFVISDTIHITVPSCNGSGTITRDFWANISGSTVLALTSNVNYATPTSTSELTIFEAPRRVANKYGSRIRGYICAPQTGNYTFYIASDDNSELWLSTDDSPANKIKIATVNFPVAPRAWRASATQKSSPIKLIKGARYYIEALHKEKINSDHLAVAWTLPNGIFEGPIAGSRLSPWYNGTNARLNFIDAVTNDNESAEQLSAYPVPADKVVTIKFHAKDESLAKISITNTVSVEVVALVKQTAKGENQLDIDVANLSAGVYFISVNTSGKHLVKRIVIQK